MITGRDSVSLSVIEAYKKGAAINDIADTFDISVDQAKRLKRYYNYLQIIEKHLSSDSYNRFLLLGLKGLALSVLFKEHDYDGLSEILSTIKDTTTREQLKHLIELRNEKKERIKKFKNQFDLKNEELIRLKTESEAKRQEIQERIKQIKEYQPYLEQFPKDAQEFLQRHIGLYHDQYALRRRIDSGWRRAMKKRGILEMNENYIWIVKDIDSFVKEYLTRKRRGNYTEWNYERELKLAGDRSNMVSSEPVYRAIKSMNKEIDDLENMIKEIEESIDGYQKQIKDLADELNKFERSELKSFEEFIVASDYRSERDLIKHTNLQNLALKWLYSQDFVACSEYTLPNNRRFDVIGYNADGKIIIIEVKISREDFLRDEKWKEYLTYCHEFYFAMDGFYVDKGLLQGAGLINPMKKSLEITYQTELIADMDISLQQSIQFDINRTLSKKYIYGF